MRFLLKVFWTFLALIFLHTSCLKAEWRIQFFLGKASTSKSDLKIKQPSKQNDLLFHNVEYDDASFKTPLYYGLRVSYFPAFASHFGIELEFIHAKIYSKFEQAVHVSGIRNGESIDSTVRLGDIIQGFSMSHGLNFLFLNLVGRVAISKKHNLDRAGLYGRVGIGPLIPHTESVIAGEEKAQYELHWPAYQLAAGSEINVWKRLDLLLEYKYTYTDVRDAEIPFGTARTKLRTNHLVFGVGGRF